MTLPENRLWNNLLHVGRRRKKFFFGKFFNSNSLKVNNGEFKNYIIMANFFLLTLFLYYSSRHFKMFKVISINLKSDSSKSFYWSHKKLVSIKRTLLNWFYFEIFFFSYLLPEGKIKFILYWFDLAKTLILWYLHFSNKNIKKTIEKNNAP
jgi:hypothetical protein